MDHHHQERTPLWGMAVHMRPLQTVRSCARCKAEKRPMLAGPRSASTVRVHVCAGLPLHLFHAVPLLAMNDSVQSTAVVQLWASPGSTFRNPTLVRRIMHINELMYVN